MNGKTTTIGLAVLLPVLLLCGPASMILLLASPEPSQAAVCGPSGKAITVNLATVPKGSVAGYRGQNWSTPR
jgi:hypothetical protein